MNVTVYAKPGCPPCNATRQHLEKLGLEYTERDVTTDDAARQTIIDLGYTAAPVVVAGDDHWTGYRPDRIKALVA